MSAQGPAGTCPACGAAAVKDGVCGRCGYAQGEINRCPHCQAVARIERKAPGTWVCAVCGGPRLPSGLGGALGVEALAEERTARAFATKLRASAWVWGAVALIAAFAVTLAWPASLVGKLIALAIAIAPTLLALRAGSKVSAEATRAEAAHERALLAAAHALAATKPDGITAAELAARLELPEPRADALLTELAVHERTRVDVGDDAEVRYSVTGDALVRVAEPGALGEARASDMGETDDTDDTDEQAAPRGASEKRR
jgi:hypothetical protein